MKDSDRVFVDFNTISFSDWSIKHRECKKRYEENKDESRVFRFVRCIDCGQMYYLGEYNVGGF